MELHQDSTYHRFLRVAAVVCAVVLLFESGLLRDSTKDLSAQTHLYLANAIGINASVPKTELNQLTAQITQKEQELQAREAALKEREIEVVLSSGVSTTDTTTYIMASILFILLVLIILNYTLDYLRMRELQDTKPV
jgi:hypothetical protein